MQKFTAWTPGSTGQGRNPVPLPLSCVTWDKPASWSLSLPWCHVGIIRASISQGGWQNSVSKGQCPGGCKVRLTLAVLICPHSFLIRYLTGMGRAWTHQNACCFNQKYSDWLTLMLFLWLKILYFTPGTYHSIKVNSDCYSCCSHKKGNWVPPGCPAWCVPIYCMSCPEFPIPTSSLLPGTKSFTIANSIWGHPSVEGCQCLTYSEADEKSPHSHSWMLPSYRTSLLKDSCVSSSERKAFSYPFHAQWKTMRSRRQKTEQACEEEEMKVMDALVYSS